MKWLDIHNHTKTFINISGKLPNFYLLSLVDPRSISKDQFTGTLWTYQIKGFRWVRSQKAKKSQENCLSGLVLIIQNKDAYKTVRTYFGFSKT